MRIITFDPSFEDWQAKARSALARGLEPALLGWEESTEMQPRLELFSRDHDEGRLAPPRPRVSRRFLEVAQRVALHAKPDKWALLYRVLWRLTHGETSLLENPVDADVLALTHYEKQVTKDAYRMTAFLRFREVSVPDGLWFVAWYEPEHDTVQLNANFFMDRFATMRWSILTPRRCMHWDRSELSFSPGVARSAAPATDAIEPLWLRYYASIFNPARLKLEAMQAQLLKRNWKNLPEAAIIEPLVRAAPRRTAAMMERSALQMGLASDFTTPAIPVDADLPALREAAAQCRACPLWRNATCTVFGEGPSTARIVFVGEQPGDQEDRSGRPFVGPAGEVLDRALRAAGIERSITYVTNAVKHFKYEAQGKRRIHKTASGREVAACRPWLAAELDIIKPTLVVALGRTACQALFHAPVRVLQERGSVLESRFGLPALVTVHPSSLLRLPAGADFEQHFQAFVADLRGATGYLAHKAGPHNTP